MLLFSSLIKILLVYREELYKFQTSQIDQAIVSNRLKKYKYPNSNKIRRLSSRIKMMLSQRIGSRRNFKYSMMILIPISTSPKSPQILTINLAVKKTLKIKVTNPPLKNQTSSKCPSAIQQHKSQNKIKTKFKSCSKTAINKSEIRKHIYKFNITLIMFF